MDARQADFYARSDAYFTALAQGDEKYFAPYLAYTALYAPKGSRLLDLGCGLGQSTYHLCRLGYQATGVDGTAGFIAKAKADFSDLDYVCAQAEILPFPDASFATVASYNTFEHLIDVPVALQEIWRILKPGGRLIIHSPNLLSIWHQINAIRRFKGMTFDGQKNLGQLILQAKINAERLWRRKFSRVPKVIKREIPDTFYFSDADATWLMNPPDMKNLLRAQGFKIIKYQNTDSLPRPGRFKKIMSRVMPEQMGIIRIVAEK